MGANYPTVPCQLCGIGIPDDGRVFCEKCIRNEAPLKGDNFKWVSYLPEGWAITLVPKP